MELLGDIEIRDRMEEIITMTYRVLNKDETDYFTITAQVKAKIACCKNPDVILDYGYCLNCHTFVDEQIEADDDDETIVTQNYSGDVLTDKKLTKDEKYLFPERLLEKANVTVHWLPLRFCQRTKFKKTAIC